MKVGIRAAARVMQISHVALIKAIKRGQVTKSDDGLYDPEICARELAENTNPLISAQSRLQRTRIREIPQREEGLESQQQSASGRLPSLIVETKAPEIPTAPVPPAGAVGLPPQANRTPHPIARPDITATTKVPAEQEDWYRAASSADTDTPPQVSPEKHTIAEAARRESWLKVRERQLKLAVQEGSLVELSVINAFVAGMIIEARDRLLQIGPENAEKIAAMTDPIEVSEFLRKQVEEALEDMSTYGVKQKAE